MKRIDWQALNRATRGRRSNPAFVCPVESRPYCYSEPLTPLKDWKLLSDRRKP